MRHTPALVGTTLLATAACLFVAAAEIPNAAAASIPSRSSDLTAAATVAPQALDDATIIAIFDRANTADIETGALAVKRGASPEVREFGAMLVRDHTHVRQLGRDLAAKLKVTPTPPSNDPSLKAHAEAMKRLGALEGAAFDHAFLQYEVTFHKGVIDAVGSTLVPAIRNAELKALVLKVVPAFEGHRLAAATLDRKREGSSSSSPHGH